MALRHLRAVAAFAAAMACLGTAPGAAAACASAGQSAAAPLATDDPEVAAPLLVQLGIWTQLMVSKGFAPDPKEPLVQCERARFDTRRGAYLLQGDKDGGSLPRIATPDRRGGVIAYLTPVPDFKTAMTEGRDVTEARLGYALQTTDGKIHTTWRIYDGVPSDSVLATDMAGALDGRLRPLMQVQGRQVRIIVPKS